MPEAPIVTHGLTKHFGDVQAVESLTLTVEPGEVFGLLGPNGAGKTTTIRMLLDFLRPTSGSATILGSDPTDPSTRQHIGYLPAELRIDPRYTATDWFDLCARLRKRDDATYRQELAARFDLDVTRPIGELSTGNRRKAAVVGAFAHRPELLILDEPTSGLDPIQQQTFRALVREAVDGGATVLLSSHVLPEVERLADRVGMISDGHLIALSTVDELRRHARHRIELHLGERATKKPWAGVPGVLDVQTSARTVRLTVQGSVDGVIKEAARHDVRRIVSREADLDEIFLDFYRGLHPGEEKGPQQGAER